MTPEEKRRNSEGCYALAIAELRRQALLEGRAQPTSEEERAMLRRDLPSARPDDAFPGSTL